MKRLGGDVELGLFYLRHEVVLIVVKQRVRGIAETADVCRFDAHHPG